ncbi:2-hydroxy-3-oxopropionate reductase [Caballeronia arationis]|uniref:NAD(P)-dependent oxidoreductase n=1 Tax=Caballeronia arationis TaxID=1777142 RepID=UPI00074C5766|nr:NAD(P)-dependent oxidoreductase [Caballeronia arationis]SAK71030.1 2-hydroxy-3-oxopropionate reductase [Caballeronia arationis]
MKIGFCGPGLMGAPMIRHLLKAGHSVQVWNRSREKALALANDGASVVDAPAALAGNEALFLCLSNAEAVEEVVFGGAGVLSGTARPAWIVDHSSIRPDATRDYAARAAREGVAWIDAPVSGGVGGAEARTLAVMAGGDAAAIDAVRGAIGAYASRVTHMGPPGAGQTAKMCNQGIVSATVAAIAEAVNLAQKSGIDAARLTEALTGGWADSVLLRTFVPRMTSATRPVTATIRTLQKDTDAIGAAALEADASMPLLAVTRSLLGEAARRGLSEDDLSAVIEVLKSPGH